MRVSDFMDMIYADFFTGVPDSQLRALCDYLMDTYGTDSRHHIIAANEGNAVALAAGYHLATGRIPVVYLQNSGEGNIINPVASLMNDKVYGIPCIFIIGWRGEPGVHDEPQHIYQGKVTLKLLEDMGIAYFVVSKETSKPQIVARMKKFNALLSTGKQVAFIVRKDGLEADNRRKYVNINKMSRENIIRHIVQYSGDDPIVSTTGKASRELFEIREVDGRGHGRDFLTVGAMGHASSIGLGIALQKLNKKIWIIDGDGAALMHMGAMAVLGANAPHNIVHIVINNGAHETVGGMPTVAEKISFVRIAEGCGYPNAVCVDSFGDLDNELAIACKREELCFIEVRCAIGARLDLGRPKGTTKENKDAFMLHLKQ